MVRSAAPRERSANASREEVSSSPASKRQRARRQFATRHASTVAFHPCARAPCSRRSLADSAHPAETNAKRRGHLCHRPARGHLNAPKTPLPVLPLSFPFCRIRVERPHIFSRVFCRASPHIGLSLKQRSRRCAGRTSTRASGRARRVTRNRPNGARFHLHIHTTARSAYQTQSCLPARAFLCDVSCTILPLTGRRDKAELTVFIDYSLSRNNTCTTTTCTNHHRNLDNGIPTCRRPASHLDSSRLRPSSGHRSRQMGPTRRQDRR